MFSLTRLPAIELLGNGQTVLISDLSDGTEQCSEFEILLGVCLKVVVRREGKGVAKPCSGCTCDGLYLCGVGGTPTLSRVVHKKACFPEAGWNPPFSCLAGEHNTASDCEQMAGGFTNGAKTVIFSVLLDELP